MLYLIHRRINTFKLHCLLVFFAVIRSQSYEHTCFLIYLLSHCSETTKGYKLQYFIYAGGTDPSNAFHVRNASLETQRYSEHVRTAAVVLLLINRFPFTYTRNWMHALVIRTQHKEKGGLPEQPLHMKCPLHMMHGIVTVSRHPTCT